MKRRRIYSTYYEVRRAMQRSQSIEQIRHRYKGEWLLISVDDLDQATTTPRRGRLLAHSKDRDALYDQLLRRKVKLPLVTYSEDQPPKGYAVAF